MTFPCPLLRALFSAVGLTAGLAVAPAAVLGQSAATATPAAPATPAPRSARPAWLVRVDAPPAEQHLRALVDGQFAFAAQQYAGLLDRIAASGDRMRSPRTFVGGKLHLVVPRDWVSGFFPVSLWLIY